MANQTNLNICTDAEGKANAKKIFEQLGLNMSTAAIEEVRAMRSDKNAHGYQNRKELRAALGV